MKMEYDTEISYTPQYFQTLMPRELMELFKEAKLALNISRGFKEKRKIQKDIDIMRIFLT